MARDRRDLDRPGTAAQGLHPLLGFLPGEALGGELPVQPVVLRRQGRPVRRRLVRVDQSSLRRLDRPQLVAEAIPLPLRLIDALLGHNELATEGGDLVAGGLRWPGASALGNGGGDRQPPAGRAAKKCLGLGFDAIAQLLDQTSPQPFVAFQLGEQLDQQRRRETPALGGHHLA